MLTARLALALVATLALSVPTFAQGKTKGLDDLAATRINPNQITVSFSYQGGACEEVGPAELGELTDGTQAVTFPTISTAEVCTMQVQTIEVEQSIPAEHIISRLDVTLTAPDGSEMATGMTDVTQE